MKMKNENSCEQFNLNPLALAAACFLASMGLFGVLASPGCQQAPAAPVDVAMTEQTAETSPQEEESKGALEKAAEILEQAKSQGGDSAKRAKDWLSDKMGDAAEAGSSTAEGTMEWANEMYKSLKDKGMTTANDAGEWISEDWNAMGSWEYKVVKLSDGVPGQMEKKLNELGNERWECFHVGASASGETVFYMKKPAKSYLKHIPLQDMLHLVPFIDSN